LALRLEKAFGVSMDMLLRIQAGFDGAQARLRGRRLKIARFAKS
jgi:plasmid maintenance system antidote protein VapI